MKRLLRLLFGRYRRVTCATCGERMHPDQQVNHAGFSGHRVAP